MRIGELARKARVAPSTIRFYERAGILSSPRRSANGYRSYDASTLDRLSFIRAGQSVGLTLAELKEIIAFRDRGEVPCMHVIELIRRRACEITAQIGQLEQMRAALERLSERAATLNPSDCPPEGICHVLVESGSDGKSSAGS